MCHNLQTSKRCKSSFQRNKIPRIYLFQNFLGIVTLDWSVVSPKQMFFLKRPSLFFFNQLEIAVSSYLLSDLFLPLNYRWSQSECCLSLIITSHIWEPPGSELTSHLMFNLKVKDQTGEATTSQTLLQPSSDSDTWLRSSIRNKNKISGACNCNYNNLFSAGAVSLCQNTERVLATYPT